MLMMVAKIGKVFWTSRDCRKLAEHLLMNFLHEILMINGMVMMVRMIYMSMYVEEDENRVGDDKDDNCVDEDEIGVDDENSDDDYDKDDEDVGGDGVWKHKRQ